MSNIENDAKVDVDLGNEVRKTKLGKRKEDDVKKTSGNLCANIKQGKTTETKKIANADNSRKKRKRKTYNRKRNDNKERMRERRAVTKAIDRNSKKKKQVLNANIRKMKRSIMERDKYHHDVIWKMTKKNQVKQKYREEKDNDSSCNSKKASYNKQRQNRKYKQDPSFRKKQVTSMKDKYHSDKQYKQKTLNLNKQKYRTNEQFKENLKTTMRNKIKHMYHNNKNFKQKQKATMKMSMRKRYLKDMHFKQKQKASMKIR